MLGGVQKRHANSSNTACCESSQSAFIGVGMSYRGHHGGAAHAHPEYQAGINIKVSTYGDCVAHSRMWELIATDGTQKDS